MTAVPRLAPEAQALLDSLPARPPRRARTLADNRDGLRAAADHLFGEREQVARVFDLTVDGRTSIPVRVYHPLPDNALPAVVYAHGGGWALGDLETHDRLCRALAARSGAAIASVDYRRAPEHPYPAAWQDVQDVVRALVEDPASFSIDPQRIALAGDSAGGQLAAATALWARDAGIDIRQVVLLMPDVDNHPEHWPSHAEFDERYGLYPDDQIWYYEQYFGPQWRARVGPGVAPIGEDLTGFPATTILLAECDPVHDEGAAFAAKLAEAGVEVEVIDMAGMFHPFILFRGLAQAREAEALISDALRARLT